MRDTDLLKICDEASNVVLLCVGDIMLDRFVYGRVERISPEAPIPVLRQDRTLTMLGAVGNVARNVASLGARAVLSGVVGEDSEGAELLDNIQGETAISGNLARLPSRRTTVKVRYIAGSQQLLRVDSEDRIGLTADEEAEVCKSIEAAAAGVHAILLSDYAKGCVTGEVIQTCLKVSLSLGIPLIVDPKGSDFSRYGAADIIKPNASELAQATGLPTGTDIEVEAALNAVLDQTTTQAVLVTRSEKGLSYKKRGEPAVHVPTVQREVFDVSGAGDTSLAALGIALATGAGLAFAARFALVAAGIAVGKVGTAAVTIDEVRADISKQQFARADLSDMSEAEAFRKIQEWRNDGLSIGFTNGCFDILHAGHLSVLQFAASHCDRLIVGLNSDASVKKLKGESRPIHNENDRATLLYGLKPVDAVIIFDADTPRDLIEAIGPDILVKGGDYDPDKIVGADTVRQRGGRVLIAPLLEGRSTTKAIEKSRNGG